MSGVTDLLMQRHHITDPTLVDFSTTSQQDRLRSVNRSPACGDLSWAVMASLWSWAALAS